jgi:hypothetical protein
MKTTRQDPVVAIAAEAAWASGAIPIVEKGLTITLAMAPIAMFIRSASIPHPNMRDTEPWDSRQLS